MSVKNVNSSYLLALPRMVPNRLEHSLRIITRSWPLLFDNTLINKFLMRKSVYIVLIIFG
jgi:hypothetical protein